ncbi:hypothetical protein HPP92_001360 [Vanilla planifolia]|uniref:Chorein N-terminal domain-containing protein n=1 Tax=Vanilla planifolia TaxID=51239 RepID=A0A835RRJ7_VANPL|nr:hypothetical protein HPP92_001360 [Vanilla planifolia]
MRSFASQEPPDIPSMADSQKYYRTSSDFENCNFFLHPFDVKLSLLANKSGKIGSALQYVVDINTTTLVISLTEIQLHQILSVLDYFSVCSLRERYGRFRPIQISLSKRHNGWQRFWWQYAQNAILADVRRKLWKSSWSYLGKRIIQRRTYAQLYRKKLELIQQEQVVSKDILLKLEEMDREYDLEDILSYRLLAEQKMQELSNANNPSKRTDCETSPSATHEKQQNDDRPSSSVRGWLNWLSLGMLGAGGTEDSSSFSGVISEEIIKDIYEATEFNLVVAVSEDSLRTENLLSSSVKLNICQIVATITNKHEKKILLATLDGISAECQFRENSSTIHALIHLVNIINPFNHKVVLFPKQAMLDDSSSHQSLPFVDFHFSLQLSDQIFEPLIKVVLQPFEAIYDLEYFLEMWELFEGFLSFQFLHKRVLLSLNGLIDFKSRLFIKADYISHYRKRMGWDIFLNSFVIKFPLSYEEACSSTILFNLEGLSFKSMPNIEKLPDLLERCPFENYDLKRCLKYIMDNGISGFQLQYFYDQFELSLTDFQVKLLMPNPEIAVSMVEKCNPIFTIIRCVFIEESFMRPFEVTCLVPLLNLRFSPTVLSLIMRLVMFPEGKSIASIRRIPIENMSDKLSGLGSSYFSLSFKLDYLNIHLALEDDTDCDTAVYFDFEKIDSWYVARETVELSCLFEKVVIITRDLRHEHDNLVLCSASSVKSPDIFVEHDSKKPNSGPSYLSKNLWFAAELFNRIAVQSFSSSACNESSIEVDQNDELWKRAIFDNSAFGFSNFCAVDTSVGASISVDHFPFVTIYDSGSFSNLENSIVNGVSRLQNLCVIEKQHPRRIKLGKKRGFSQDYSVLNKLKLSKFDDIISLDINLNASKAHFHDCSCVLGTISLPEFQCIISFHGNNKWDVLVSADGLSLSSPLSPHEVLWGSVSSVFSPVLNVRARKSEKQEPLNISFGFQHVKCILTSEFLGMLIGYFSLSDWSLKGTMKEDEQWTSSNDEFYGSSGFGAQIFYKFEILESIVIFPVEDHLAFCLQVDAPWFYCSFMLASTSENAFEGISLEYEYFFDGVGAIMSRKINEEAVDITDRPNEFSFILKACAKALSFNFSRSNVKEASTVETIANLYVRLDCSASVRNGLLKSLDAEVSSFLLHSFCNDVLLASFTSDDGATFRIGINFCRSLQGSAEVVFAIPAIDIWLHIPEWVSINAFLCSLKGKLDILFPSTVVNLKSSYKDNSESVSSCSASESTMLETEIFTMKSESIIISFHVPLYDNEQDSSKFDVYKPDQYNVLGTTAALNASAFELKPSKQLKLLFQMGLPWTNPGDLDQVLCGSHSFEPWSFRFSFIRKRAGNILLDRSKTMEVCMESTDQLNLNITEPLVEPGFSVPIYIEETVDELLFRHRKACSSELLIEKKLSATLHNMISIHFDGTSGPSKSMSMDLVGLRFFEVILLNSTSMPLEVRFDIPFGISPKILDPLLPEQELALPLHLAETGHIRFHPVGTNYLWSEAQSLPNILLHENRPGLLRSFVCYPTQPSSDPFRCCISVEDHSLSSFGAARKCPSLIHNVTEKSKFKNIVKGVFNGNSASCFAVDSTHDLEVTYRIEGYKPVVSKFPRTETFSEIAKFSGSKYFLHERIYFYSCASSGLLCVNLEKVLHQSCSAREIILYTSYLLYNCTGLSLAIVDRNHEHKGIAHIILPSYQILEQEQVEDGKQGLASLTSQFKSFQDFSMNGDRDKYPEYPSGKAGNSVESTVHSLSEEAMPYMYDPVDHIPAAELLVSLAASSNLIRDEKVHRMTWSAPFPLAPSSGSTNVTIPKSNATGAFLISATLITAMGELSGRTKAIAFQPSTKASSNESTNLSYLFKGIHLLLANRDILYVMLATKTCASNKRGQIFSIICPWGNTVIFTCLISQESCLFLFVSMIEDGNGQAASFQIALEMFN